MGSIIQRIAELKEREKEIKKEIEDLYSTLPESQKPGNYVEGNYVLTVTPRREFNPAQAESVLSQRKWKSILVPKPDTKVARQLLTGEEYESCLKVTGVTRTVKEVVEG